MPSMRVTNTWLPASIAFLAFGATAVARDVIDDLLELAPVTKTSLRGADLMKAIASGSYPSQPAAPPVDAPAEVLVGYWSNLTGGKAPDDVQAKLLEVAAHFPDRIPGLLPHLGDDERIQDWVWGVLQAQGAAQSDAWRDALRDWLTPRGKYFKDELSRGALAATDSDGWVKGEAELAALARHDWSTARPVLERLAAGPQPRTAALAAALVYEHLLRVEDPDGALGWRSRLMNIVEDPAAPCFSRDRAMSALFVEDWDGRDDWYLSLLSDQTLRDCHDGFHVFRPITTPVGRDPARFIPIMTEKVKAHDRAVHDAAVASLIQFVLRNARGDALKPLLPWIADPSWSDAPDRLRLIQSVKQVGLLESSIPGLVWVVAHDPDEACRAYAAEALTEAREPSAIPALKAAFPTMTNAQYRRFVVRALLQADGVPVQEQARALEALALHSVTEEDRAALDRAYYDRKGAAQLPSEVLLGMAIASARPLQEGVTRILLDRASRLDRSDATGASAVRRMMERSPSPALRRDALRRIDERLADAETVAFLLTSTAETEVLPPAAKDGSALGAVVRLVIDRDRDRLLHILDGADAEYQRAVLACARLLREPLPLQRVTALLSSGDDHVAHTAERYLEAEDTPEARKAILAHHPGEGLILGQGGGFEDSEEQLREEVITGKTEEVIALLSAGYFRGPSHIVIRQSSGRADLAVYEDPARVLRRTLSEDEATSLSAFLHSIRADDLPALETPVLDGVVYEYLHLTADGGRRVYMNNPGMAGTGGTPHDLLVERIHALRRAGSLHVDYHVGHRLDGLEILISDPSWTVLSGWEEGADVRALVTKGRDDTPEWRRVGPAGVGERTAAPPPFKAHGSQSLPEELDVEESHNPRIEDNVLQGTVIVKGRMGPQEGIWRCAKGKPPQLMLECNCAMPVVSPDGKWLAVARVEGNWATPNGIIRMDLGTGSVYEVDIPKADTLEPLAFIASHARILVLRQEPVGDPTFFLLDPRSGAVTAIEGDFRPYLTADGSWVRSGRALQATGRPDEFWTVVQGEEDATVIGRYNTRTFTFAPVMRLPEIRFESAQMWVDSKQRRLLVAYGGHLLRMPFVADAGTESAPDPTVR